MFMDGEITFLAALSLLLANMVLPNSTASSFLDLAKGILQEMGDKGNLPVAALKDELHDICELAATACASNTNLGISFQQFARPLSVISDAETLNNAILIVLEAMECSLDSPSDAHESHVPNHALAGQDRRPPVQQLSDSQPAFNPLIPATLPSHDSLVASQSTELYLDQVHLQGVDQPIRLQHGRHRLVRLCLIQYQQATIFYNLFALLPATLDRVS